MSFLIFGQFRVKHSPPQQPPSDEPLAGIFGEAIIDMFNQGENRQPTETQQKRLG